MLLEIQIRGGSKNNSFISIDPNNNNNNNNSNSNNNNNSSNVTNPSSNYYPMDQTFTPQTQT